MNEGQAKFGGNQEKRKTSKGFEGRRKEEEKERGNKKKMNNTTQTMMYAAPLEYIWAWKERDRNLNDDFIYNIDAWDNGCDWLGCVCMVWGVKTEVVILVLVPSTCLFFSSTFHCRVARRPGCLRWGMRTTSRRRLLGYRRYDEWSRWGFVESRCSAETACGDWCNTTDGSGREVACCSTESCGWDPEANTCWYLYWEIRMLWGGHRLTMTVSQIMCIIDMKGAKKWSMERTNEQRRYEQLYSNSKTHVNSRKSADYSGRKQHWTRVIAWIEQQRIILLEFQGFPSSVDG